MIWKQFLKPVFGFSALFAAFFMLDFWTGKNPKLGSHEFIFYAIVVIALSMGLVGHYELKIAGYRKILGVLNSLILVMFSATFILALAKKYLHWRITWLGADGAYLFIPIYALIAAFFPLSLYLNLKERKATVKRIIANAP